MVAIISSTPRQVLFADLIALNICESSKLGPPLLIKWFTRDLWCVACACWVCRVHACSLGVVNVFVALQLTTLNGHRHRFIHILMFNFVCTPAWQHTLGCSRVLLPSLPPTPCLRHWQSLLDMSSASLGNRHQILSGCYIKVVR